jgi:hypothetical protein
MAIDSVIFGFGYRARSGKDTAVAEIIKQRGLLDPKGIPFLIEYSSYDIRKWAPAELRDAEKERYDIRKYSFADALRREVDDAIGRAGGAFSLLVANRPTHFVQANENLIELPDWVVLEENPEINEQYPLGKQRPLLQWWGTEYRRSIDPDYWVRQLAQRIELEKPQIALITDMRFPNEMAFVKQYGETILVQRDGLPPSTHASETALADTSPEDWSIILENNGTLEELKEGAVTVFDELLINFPFGCNKVSA